MRRDGLIVRYVLWPAAVAVLLLPGCAVYEHRLIEPAEVTGPIGREGVVFSIDPLEYEAARHGDRLALRVHNPTDDEIAVLGERSYIVDPTGETRAMRAGVIAPRSHITMILPPEPTAVRTGPRVGVGVGVGTGFGRYSRFGAGVHDPWYHRPTYTYIMEEGAYWRWVTGIVRVRLHYERAGESFRHDLAFERVRVQ